MKKKTHVLERLCARTVIDPETGCWIWQGCRNSDGYGNIGVGSRRDGSHRSIGAHIASYRCLVGPVPEGCELDHLCRNRACWNPDHLQPVSHHVNVVRGLVGSRERNRTCCIHGHPFNEENTRVTSAGKRACRTCQRMRTRRRCEHTERTARCDVCGDLFTSARYVLMHKTRMHTPTAEMPGTPRA